MALLDKMKDSISVASQGVSQKAKTATESMRLGNQMKANDRMIEKLTYQVGVQCVRNHVDEAGTEYDALFSEILRLRRENQSLQAEIQALSAGNVCPQCGFGNNPGSKFCISCGSPLNAAPVGGKTCGGCGAVNAEDAMFCVECGKKFEAEAPAVEIPVPAAELVQEEALAEEMPVMAEVPVMQEEVAVEAPMSEEMSGSRCRNCGALLEEDALFCVECGTRREE